MTELSNQQRANRIFAEITMLRRELDIAMERFDRRKDKEGLAQAILSHGDDIAQAEELCQLTHRLNKEYSDHFSDESAEEWLKVAAHVRNYALRRLVDESSEHSSNPWHNAHKHYQRRACARLVHAFERHLPLGI